MAWGDIPQTASKATPAISVLCTILQEEMTGTNGRAATVLSEKSILCWYISLDPTCPPVIRITAVRELSGTGSPAGTLT